MKDTSSGQERGLKQRAKGYFFKFFPMAISKNWENAWNNEEENEIWTAAE